MVKRNPLILKKDNSKIKFNEGNKSAGILDDFAVRKNVATKEGTIEKVPVNDSDIVNKKYVNDGFVPYTSATSNVNLGSYKLYYAGGSVSGILNFADQVNIELGNGADARLKWDTILTNNAVKLSIYAGNNTSGSGAVVICEKDELNYNFAIPTSSNPSLYLFSGQASTDEYIKLQHDKTNATISTGKGDLILNPNSSIDANSKTLKNAVLASSCTGFKTLFYGSNPGGAPDSVVKYFNLGAGSTTTESWTQITLNNAFVLNYLAVNIHINTRSTASTYALRDDGASLDTISITASTTGQFIDTGASGTIASGSLINFMLDVTAGTGIIGLYVCSAEGTF